MERMIKMLSSYKEQINKIIDQLPEDKVLDVLLAAEFAKERIDFVQSFTNKGVIVTEMIGEMQDYKDNWEREFTSDIPIKVKEDISFESFLWHVFSYGVLKSIEKEDSIVAFNNVKKGNCYVFYQYLDLVYKFENASSLTTADFENEQDVYIVDEDYTWTYINTHESEHGPYFYKKTD